MMNLLKAMRIVGAIVEHGGPSGAIEADAGATVCRSPVAGCPLPEATRRGDAASIAAPTTLHRLTR
ncbi:hypothetical protein CFB46_30815 [Burkholderia sp. HI2761]|uniref:hypothetical protein n=1 Tax=Burkholderia TaxID=32008 RepID=UPI00040616C6|nr:MULTISPECIES: hypothetical protein [Burkholderia]MPV60822.1 hypothetical protein [Burkholderia sp. BE24]OXJ22218.1 hypothetical protein CFB46_30815 [Burkholderia sp. HI2761]